jgi:hypothetical protein
MEAVCISSTGLHWVMMQKTAVWLCQLLTLYSRASQCVASHFALLFIHESPCTGMLRNKQDATSAWLSHSVATYISSNMKSTLYFSQFLELTVTYMFELYLESMTHMPMKSLNLKIKGLCQTRQKCFETWELVLQCLDDSIVCTDQQSISSRTMTTRAGKAQHSKEHLHVIPQKKGSQISRRLIPRRFLSWWQSEEDFECWVNHMMKEILTLL